MPEPSGVGSVLFLHAGVADSRMWGPQVEVLQAAGYRVIAPDLRGFGEHRLQPTPFSYVRDVEALLDGPVAVVGNSLGGRVALELAVHCGDLVERLVLIAPGFPGWEWSDETRAGWAAEEKAYEAGDLQAAAEASVRLWVDGPNRAPEEVDSGVRELVTEMVLRSYEMQQGAWEAGAREEEVLAPPISGRLDEVRCPTLVLVGEDDVKDMRGIADHVAHSIAGARLERIADAAHLPSLERVDEVNSLLLAFLGDT
jgi:3-oxoadipate enol-lactonase